MKSKPTERPGIAESPPLQISTFDRGRGIRIVLVWALLALGFALYRIGQSSFWLDEIFTIHVAGRSMGEILRTFRTGTDSTPPFFYLLIHKVISWGGEETWLRLPSAFAAVGAAVLAGRMAWKCAGVAAGWATVLSLATSTVWIRHSQEVRMYGFVMLFSVLSFSLFWAAWSSDQRVRRWPALLAANLAGVAVSRLGVLIVLAEAVLAVAEWGLDRSRARRTFRLARLLGVLALSLLPALWDWRSTVATLVTAAPHFRVHPDFIHQFAFLASKIAVFPYPFRTLDPPADALMLLRACWPAFLSLFFAVAAAIGGLICLLREDRRRGMYFAYWMATGLGAAWWCSIKGWMFEERIVTYLVPAFHVLAGVGLAGTLSTGRWRRLVPVLYFAVAAASALSYYRAPRKDWAGAIEYLQKQASDGDTIVLTGLSPYSFSYYWSRAAGPRPKVQFALMPGPLQSGVAVVPPCELYALRSPRQMLILDGLMAPCGLPFMPGTPVRSVFSTTELEEVVSGSGTEWMIVETGNQGIPFWRPPWRQTLQEAIATSNSKEHFGSGEGVWVLSVDRDYGSAGAGTDALHRRWKVAMWPEGRIRIRTRVEEAGNYSLSLGWAVEDAWFRRRLKGRRYAEEERETPIHLRIRVDEGQSLEAEIRDAGKREAGIVDLRLESGEHIIEIAPLAETARAFEQQQRALPLGEIVLLRKTER